MMLLHHLLDILLLKKKKSELNDLNGDYLLLNFDCIGTVEFKNNKSNNTLKTY